MAANRDSLKSLCFNYEQGAVGESNTIIEIPPHNGANPDIYHEQALARYSNYGSIHESRVADDGSIHVSFVDKRSAAMAMTAMNAKRNSRARCLWGPQVGDSTVRFPPECILEPDEMKNVASISSDDEEDENGEEGGTIIEFFSIFDEISTWTWFGSILAILSRSVESC